MWDNYRWVIFDTSETSSINFNQVQETSIDTLRLNYSGSQTFVKYIGDMPPTVSNPNELLGILLKIDLDYNGRSSRTRYSNKGVNISIRRS